MQAHSTWQIAIRRINQAQPRFLTDIDRRYSAARNARLPLWLTPSARDAARWAYRSRDVSVLGT